MAQIKNDLCCGIRIIQNILLPGSYLWAEMQVTGCMRDFDIRHQSVSLSLSVNHLEELLMSFSARNSPHLRRDGEVNEILNPACIQ